MRMSRTDSSIGMLGPLLVVLFEGGFGGNKSAGLDLEVSKSGIIPRSSSLPPACGLRCELSADSVAIPPWSLTQRNHVPD